jgi:hypothetical protein
MPRVTLTGFAKDTSRQVLKLKYPAFFENVLWVAFLIPSGSLSLVDQLY